LINAARQDLNLDLGESWFVGDSTADLGAAEEAGVSSILVETGSGGLDDRYPYEAGFTVPDFAAAVSFIIEGYPRLAATLGPLVERIGAGEDWFIGGLARTGKSTLAAGVARALRRRGQAVAVVQLDRWILPEGERGEGVLGRYEMPAIEATFRALAARAGGVVSLPLPAYSRRLRRRLAAQRMLHLAPGCVVLWEGTIAVALAERFGLADRSVHLETDAAIRQARFAHYDQRRGLASAESSARWAVRQADEHPVLAALGRRAGYVISLDAAFAVAGEQPVTQRIVK
jgi:uridine kinase